jgi:putative transposase
MSVDNTSSLESHVLGKSSLSEILKMGAKRLLMQAVEAEVEVYISQNQFQRDEKGRKLVVRNGFSQERTIQTGLGPFEISMPRINDRRPGEKFSSRILPPYLRKTKEIEELIPWLYLSGVSSGDFSEALFSIVGENARGFSANTVVRLKEVWQEEYQVWKKRRFSENEYVYIWADGVYFNLRLEGERQCILVIIGVKADGTKELVAVEDGVRESEMSWTQILLDLKERGFEKGPDLAIGDGALGFWNALSKIFPSTKHQRCWVHKTQNVLNKLPQSQQTQAKSLLNEIYMSATENEAIIAWRIFVTIFGEKYPKAVECLEKDKNNLLTFYSFPAVHWVHIRSSNVIESLFATVRLRHRKTKGSANANACLAMVFKLSLNAQKGWRKIRGYEKLVDVVNKVEYVDGMRKAA